MNNSVENGDVNGYYCYINSSTGNFINNHNYIDYTNRRYEMYTNIYLRENNGLPDGVEINDMLSAPTPNQFVYMEHNNEYNNIHKNGNISTPNSSPVSALNSPSFTSTNE